MGRISTRDKTTYQRQPALAAFAFSNLQTDPYHSEHLGWLEYGRGESFHRFVCWDVATVEYG